MKNYPAEKIRNVAIVGHGGAGKTMLIEHMLYTAGATERVGSVEAGNTQSDYDPIEIRRKISLNASVVPLEWHGCKVNIIDVPGFPDFIGDLYGAARVVESMVLVCEAKRDLDVGFELAWEVSEQYGLAKCIFVNKLERDNADFAGLMETLRERYGRKVVQVQIPIGHQATFDGVLDLLSMKVFRGKDRGDQNEDAPTGLVDEASSLRDQMMDAAAEGDDDLALKYLEGEELTTEEIEHGLLVGIASGKIVPVLIGSAASGIGVHLLLDRICGEMPSPVDIPKTFEGVSHLKSDANLPLVGYTFKTTADPYVGKINFVRILQGSLKVDDTVRNVTEEHDERVHNLFLPHGKGQEPATLVTAGDICAIAKLQNTRTGDTLTSQKERVQLPPIEFPEPIYRVAVVPATKADEDKLGPAVQRLLEEDPTFKAVYDAVGHQHIFEGMGDIHLDVIIEKLKTKFGVTVKTEDARVPYRETVRSSSKAQGRHKRQTGGKGQFGDCWIELDPLPRGEGFVFENKVVGGSIPKNFIPAIEKGIRETMEHGFVAGYLAQDMKVTVYDGSYHDVDSSEAAFKMAGAIAIRAAVEKAGAIILEPILDLQVDVPDDAVGDVVGDLNGRRGRMQGMEPVAPGKTRVNAQVPMATMGRYALDLRSITKGRGRFKQRVSHYEELPHPETQALITEYQKKRAEHENE